MYEKCFSCEHFIQHYGITREYDIFKVGCGHCVIHAKRQKCDDYLPASAEKFFGENVYKLSQMYDKVVLMQEKILNYIIKFTNDISKPSKK